MKGRIVEKFWIVAAALAVIALAGFIGGLNVTPAHAATSQTVNVTATPAFIGIANAPTDWFVNGEVAGDMRVRPGPVEYYTNPLGDETAPSATVVDGECRFTITNTSTVAIDLTVLFSHFGGGDAIQNADTGTETATQFGANSYFSGDTYPGGRVPAKNAASAIGKDALAASTDIKWGLDLTFQTNAWASGTAMTANVTITATED